MKVSVAMATYNGMMYLEEQMDSILSQLIQEDELIVSDDGSTDGTREFLEALCAREARVRLLDGPRRGVIANFENALSACTGDGIFLADQDDVWRPDKRARVVDTFQKTGAVLVMHDAAITDEHGITVHPSFFTWRGTRTGLIKNLWKNSYIGCCMAFSKALLPHILPMPEGIAMHDQWIGLQAERHGKVVLLDTPLLAYRRHGGNATADGHGTLGTMLRQRWGTVKALCKRR